MSRLPSAVLVHLLVCATLLVALAPTGCDSGTQRALCADDTECAAFCEQLSLPIDGARCAGGQCTCEVPSDVDGSDLDAAGDTTDPDTTDAARDTSDTSPADVRRDSADALDGTSRDQRDQASDASSDMPDTRSDATDVTSARCPPDMVDLGDVCIDRYEAPNYEGALPLVMYTFDEAAAWCAARDKRLCFDDEWTTACTGPQQTAYPYGDTHQPGVCNDDETWKAYNQTLLNGWPWTLPTSQIDALSNLLDAARSIGPSAAAAADHVESLYQGEPSGANPDCTQSGEVFDLTGNVEEWTRRRDGGNGPDYQGNLKGRYWADTRTCFDNITSHANGFRFYELGFRCCADPVD